MKTCDYILDNDNDQIPWRLFVPEGAGEEYAVLWLQGWSSSMDGHRAGVERMVERTGVVWATMDYAGHGLHETPIEDSTHRQQYGEVVAVFDELVRRGYERIVVIGGSFGSYMAALLAGARPVHAVVLRAPANYPDEEFEVPFRETLRFRDLTEYERVRREDGWAVDSRAVKALRGYDGLVYVMEHELDEVVPARMPKEYFAAAKRGNYWIVPKTKHSPKLMADAQAHFDYIEQVVVAMVGAVKVGDGMKGPE